MQLTQQQATVERELHRAMALARSGELGSAETILDGIIDRVPDQPDALQLLGMIARRRNDHHAAVSLFRKSLAAHPLQSNVSNNLGNSLADLGRVQEAIASYREALRLRPDYADASVNLAVALLANGEAAAARDTLTSVLADNRQDPRAWATLGQALRELGDLAAAIEAFETSLLQRPEHIPTRHNLAVTLRLSGRPDAALPILLEVAEAQPTAPAVSYNLGHCLQDLGRIGEASSAYRDAIRLRPKDRAAHDSLNRMLWQQGRLDSYLSSYTEALSLHPGDPGLLSDLANRLIIDGHAEGAILLLQPAVAGAGAELHHRLGQAYWACGSLDEALEEYKAALAADPHYAPAVREIARALLILDRPAEALTPLTSILARDPSDQQALALQGIAWRLTGDERADWLCDVERFVSTELVFPSGGDIDEFNAELDAALSSFHQASQAPLEQTLRHGTQTTDDLFSRDCPQIAAVRTMIEAGIAHYVAKLPYDPGHPFLRRKASGFAFSGSWSVRLRRSGYHENHIHPEGWISGCYYVALPPAVDEGSQGWLKVGESSLRLGAREQIPLLVRPQRGLLVLFPSYFYHGTVPFDDAQHRTTIAFDVVPVG